MTPNAILDLLAPRDIAALGLLAVSWAYIGWRIERPGARRPSVSVLMAEMRREWMRQLAARDVRIFDAQVLTSLRQGTAFLASTSLLAVGGVLALIGNPEPLRQTASDLAVDTPSEALWRLKLALPALFLTHAFLKFIWANRLFGYCAVLMGAIPNAPGTDLTYARAAQTGEINVRAAYNFNRGLRALYFALGSVAWLVGAIPLIFGTLVVVWMIWSREFRSTSRRVLTQTPVSPPAKEPPT